MAPPKPRRAQPRDRTLSITIGPNGGFYGRRRNSLNGTGWRLCLWRVAFTWTVGDIPRHEAMALGAMAALRKPAEARDLLEKMGYGKVE